MIVGSVNNKAKAAKRGAFILLEGVDRCGKTTQCSLLMKHLLSLSIAAVAMRFPDRTTTVGQLINGYLSNAQNVDDRAIHLLFSSNRWEVSSTLAQTLADGKTVVCDRYAYSGVAFSSAKTKEDRHQSLTIDGDIGTDLSVDWCKAPDVGLPAPDVVIFLDLSQEESEKRGGYGGERYEKRDLQIRVRKRFAELQAMDEVEGRIPWNVIDASQSIDQVQKDINKVVEETLHRVNDGSPLCKMFQEGHYQLPSSSSS